MRTSRLTISIGFLCTALFAQADWPEYGHDPGATRYSPLKQINTKNVAHLKVAWTFDTQAPITQAAPAAARAPADAGGHQQPASPRRPIARRSEATPLVVNDVMYLSTGYNRVLALEPETGKKIWEYESAHSPAMRGIAYWPGEAGLPPQIVFGTADGWLISLNAKTGKPVPGFGNEGMVNLKPGVADNFPTRMYGMSSPPSIYKNVVITGAHLPESPSLGPSGDIRGWDMRTGKLLWTFHTIPRPGEPNHDVWSGDQWVDRSGVNCWGFITVDTALGIAYVPLGTPTTDFYGADRKGSNLYGSSLVALDAETGKLKWYFQTTHHDNWDYDLEAPPTLIEVKHGGHKIPAVAVSTKQGLLFMFDRITGKPIYDVKEQSVTLDNPFPGGGDEPWPTQPVPVKPPALARNSFRPDEIATVTPEHEQFCKNLLGQEGGAMGGGPFALYGPKLRVIFPSWIGGGNWGGVSYDPHLGYIFVNTQSVGNINKLVKSDDGKRFLRVGPDDHSLSLGEGNLFWDGEKNWPCQQPPWGLLTAINADTGDIAWQTPLGSFDELDAKGVPKTGTPNMGGSVVTAGGVLFIAATVDSRIRAFDSRTGKELWSAKMDSDAQANPITFMGKNGKQYVAILANGSVHYVRPPAPGRLYVFALP